jgi:predicted ATPase
MALYEALQVRSAVALTGLGGIGKTQAALAYAYGQRQDYRAVLWVRAATREDLIAGFTTLATVLGLPERNAAEQAQTVAAVRRWLERSSDWLLILDNADELSLVQEFLPVHRLGRLLMTTRSAATGEVAKPLAVERLTSDVGALFLLRRAGRLAPEALLAAASPEDQAAARAVTEELGGLPLALDQAGAYLEEMQLTPGEYLSLYQQAGRSLRARRGELAADHASVTVTFSLAFEKVAATSPAAAEFLRLCAFLHPSGIPEEMLIEGAAELGPVLGPVLAQPLGLIELRREAGRFSLLHRDPDSRTLLIHPVVQAVLKDDLEAATQHDWQARVIRLVNQGFPFVELGLFIATEKFLALRGLR